MLLSINSGGRVAALLQSLKNIYCLSVCNIAGIRWNVLEGFCKIQSDSYVMVYFWVGFV